MKAYIASGWFNGKQANDLETIKKVCKEFDIDFFSPKDECLCPPDASEDQQEATFVKNLTSIMDADFLIANTRDKDMGTIFECGYAFASDIPIFYYCEGLKGAFNLMLARSGIAVARSESDLRKILKITKEKKTIEKLKQYQGEIE